jgi:hypothetical protein
MTIGEVYVETLQSATKNQNATRMTGALDFRRII